MPSTWKDFVDFYSLVKGKTNRESLTEQNEISRPTLSLRFKPFFDLTIPPLIVWKLLPPKSLLLPNLPWIYGTDGKWLHRAGVIMNHRDITNRENLWWSYHTSESYEAYDLDLGELSKELVNNLPSGAVSDWKGAGVMGIIRHFGLIPHQRCLAHVLRTLKSLLPKNSPILETRKLRSIAKEIIHLKDETDVWNWQSGLVDWEKQYSKSLTIKTIGVNTKKKWWYTHGDLRRAWRLLIKDQNHFFVHISHKLIPPTNNSLEGVNSQMKQKLGDHRGMKLPQQVSFAFWYYTFSRIKNTSDLKKLWVGWKKSYNSKKAH